MPVLGMPDSFTSTLNSSPAFAVALPAISETESAADTLAGTDTSIAMTVSADRMDLVFFMMIFSFTM